MNYLQLPVDALPYLARLSGVQVGIWADAWTWEQQGKQAYRTNEQLAEMFGVTVKSISCAISNLRKSGLIEWQMINGRQRILKATLPSNVNHPAERKPSRSTSIPSNVNTASRPTLRVHPVEGKGCIPSNVNQVEHRVEQEVKQEVEQAPKKKKEEVVMPWETEAFRAAWTQWKDYKKSQFRFTFKSNSTEQVSLHQLKTISNNDERTAIDIIGQSIGNGWKGFFTLKNGGRNRQDAKLDANKALEWANK